MKESSSGGIQSFASGVVLPLWTTYEVGDGYSRHVKIFREGVFNGTNGTDLGKGCYLRVEQILSPKTSKGAR